MTPAPPWTPERVAETKTLCEAKFVVNGVGCAVCGAQGPSCDVRCVMCWQFKRAVELSTAFPDALAEIERLTAQVREAEADIASLKDEILRLDARWDALRPWLGQRERMEMARLEREPSTARELERQP